MQNYIVIEIQIDANGTAAVIPTAFEDINVARQKYHTILAAAAVSALPVHCAAILDPADPNGMISGLVVEQYVFRRNAARDDE